MRCKLLSVPFEQVKAAMQAENEAFSCMFARGGERGADGLLEKASSRLHQNQEPLRPLSRSDEQCEMPQLGSAALSHERKEP